MRRSALVPTRYFAAFQLLLPSPLAHILHKHITISSKSRVCNDSSKPFVVIAWGKNNLKKK